MTRNQPASWTSAEHAAQVIRRMQERNAPRRAEVERIVARMRRYNESLRRGTR